MGAEDLNSGPCGLHSQCFVPTSVLGYFRMKAQHITSSSQDYLSPNDKASSSSYYHL